MGIEVSFEGVTGQGLLRCASAKSEVQHCTWPHSPVHSAKAFGAWIDAWVMCRSWSAP